MSPLIGITTYGIDQASNYSLPEPYVAATRRAGGIPVLIPPGETRVDELLPRLDGLILAGGGDIDPTTYGGQPHPTVYMVDPQRDATEIALTKAVIQSGLPTLAICRGAQIVNVALGGTLHEHIPDVFGDAIAHRLPPRVPTSHEIRLQRESRLYGLLQRHVFEAASWHHQALRDVAGDLRVVADAPDGVIEAFEMPDHPWLVGVQWHPELTAKEDATQQRLFDALVTAAREAHSKQP